MDDFSRGIGRRRFVQRCGLLALAALFPAFYGRHAARTPDGYWVINGWVIPWGHLERRDDA